MDYKMEELLPVVKDLSERYTGKESTSITYETARHLMEAVLYCLNENNETLLRPEMEEGTGLGSLHMLKSSCPVSAAEAYQNGYELLLQKVRKARTVYEEVAADFNAYGNLACSETVLKGIPAFFLYYDAKFDPENAVITMDYPILADMSRWRGGDAVCFYLDCIRLEQRFLKRFPEDTVRSFLLSADSGCKELFINLCGTVLRGVLACMMLGKQVSGETFTPEEYKRLEQLTVKLADAPRQDGLKNYLSELLEQFTGRVFPGDEELHSYLKLDIPNFAFELRNAAEHGNLSNLL